VGESLNGKAQQSAEKWSHLMTAQKAAEKPRQLAHEENRVCCGFWLFWLLTYNFLFHWDSSSVERGDFKVPFGVNKGRKSTAKISYLDSRHDSTAGGIRPTGPIRSGLRSRKCESRRGSSAAETTFTFTFPFYLLPPLPLLWMLSLSI